MLNFTWAFWKSVLSAQQQLCDYFLKLIFIEIKLLRWQFRKSVFLTETWRTTNNTVFVSIFSEFRSITWSFIDWNNAAPFRDHWSRSCELHLPSVSFMISILTQAEQLRVKSFVRDPQWRPVDCDSNYKCEHTMLLCAACEPVSKNVQITLLTVKRHSHFKN